MTRGGSPFGRTARGVAGEDSPAERAEANQVAPAAETVLPRNVRRLSMRDCGMVDTLAALSLNPHGRFQPGKRPLEFGGFFRRELALAEADPVELLGQTRANAAE